MLAAIALTVTFVLIVLYQQVSPGHSRSLTVSGWLLLSFFLFGILHACSFLGYFVGHRGSKQTRVDATIDPDTDLVATEETGNPYQPPSF